MTARRAALERADDVRHRRLRRDDAKRELVGFEEAGDVLGGQRRVPRRVRALGPHEIAEEADDGLAVLVDPFRELTLEVVHGPPLPAESAESIH
jgi:hypothetical protein